MTTPTKKKIEIWSDIMCPFCYIGRAHLMKALDQLENKEKFQIEWKSFQLDPSIPDPVVNKKSMFENLADMKGISLKDSIEMHKHVSEMGENAGVVFNWEKVTLANSLRVHRLLHKAKELGLGDTLKKHFFDAYFIDGKDLADEKILTEVVQEIGITGEQISDALYNDEYLKRVQKDIQEAGQLGVRGVPFFVFDRQYAISGAQPVEHFIEVIQKLED